jgi:hypothetical protein
MQLECHFICGLGPAEPGMSLSRECTELNEHEFNRMDVASRELLLQRKRPLGDPSGLRVGGRAGLKLGATTKQNRLSNRRAVAVQELEADERIATDPAA